MTIDEWLNSRFESVEPMEFYGDIFPDGELATEGDYEEGKYAAIAVEITGKTYPDGKPIIHRHSIFDGLDKIDELLYSTNFVVVAPISYIGKSRKSANARFMYALCIELDHIIFDKDGYPEGLGNMFAQINKAKFLPLPSYIVSSGSGIHLYYAFEKPIPMFKNVAKSIEKLKRELTRKLWNGWNTYDHEDGKIQYESIFQAFRLAGGITKRGGRTSVYRTGEKVTLEYLNEFVRDEYKASVVYKSELPLAKAKKLYPEWYQRRIVEKQPKGTWTCDRAVYDWWLRRISEEAKVGHRYYCLMTLAVYAIKCGIEYEELERDCFGLLDMYESKTEKDDNHFTEKDIFDALQVFLDKGYFTYPVNSISNRSGIHIEKNRRNGRKRNNHLARIRLLQEFDDPDGNWRNKDGAPTKEEIVKEWKRKNPDGKKMDCHRDTGLSRQTIHKWWDLV